MLKIDDSTVIDESQDIMLWALETTGDTEWFYRKKESQAEMIRRNDTEFKHWLDRYKYHERYPENTIKFYNNQCSLILNEYEKLLQNSSFLYAEKMFLADAAIFPFVRQFAHVELNTFENTFPNTAQWLAAIKQSDLFLSVMDKYDIWSPEIPAPIVNFNLKTSGNLPGV